MTRNAMHIIFSIIEHFCNSLTTNLNLRHREGCAYILNNMYSREKKLLDEKGWGMGVALAGTFFIR